MSGCCSRAHCEVWRGLLDSEGNPGLEDLLKALLLALELVGLDIKAVAAGELDAEAIVLEDDAHAVDGGRASTADGAGGSEQGGEDERALSVTGVDEGAIRTEIRGSRLRPTDDGSEEDDLTVGIAVEVAAVEEVFGVAVAVVVVDVHADGPEAGGCQEKVAIRAIETVEGEGGIEERGGGVDSGFGGTLVDPVGACETRDRCATDIGEDGCFAAKFLPDKAFAQTLARNN